MTRSSPAVQGRPAGHVRGNTGYVYLNNRYHDPTLGMFVSVDPLATTTGEPYIYASGNPISYLDSSGLFSCFVPDNPWACLDSSAILKKVDASAPANPLDPRAPSPTALRLEDAPRTDFTVKWYDTAALAQDFNDQSYIGPTVQHHRDGTNQIYFESGTVGWSFTVCVGVCVSAGQFDSHDEALWFLTLGGLGAGASLDLHTTSQPACAQDGWSVGGSYGAGWGGGVSFGSEVGPWYDVDTSNADVTASYGFRVTPFITDKALQTVMGASGGTAHTWVFGC